MADRFPRARDGAVNQALKKPEEFRMDKLRKDFIQQATNLDVQLLEQKRAAAVAMYAMLSGDSVIKSPVQIAKALDRMGAGFLEDFEALKEEVNAAFPGHVPDIKTHTFRTNPDGTLTAVEAE